MKSIKPNMLTKSITAILVLVLFAQSGYPAMAQTVDAQSGVMIAGTQTDQQAVAAVVTTPTPAPTVQDVLLSVCEAKGYSDSCAKTLLGMLWNESKNVSTAVGDHGLALGYFQIHYKLHNITSDCATDLQCSANWTLTYMEAHSYPKYISYAVQCHNSCNADNGYAARAITMGKNLWDQPLTISQAAPIQLAVNN